MLSYMLPVDEKPPPAPGKAHLQLTLSASLSNGRGGGGGHPPSNCLSKENSISSFASSDSTTATATPTSLNERHHHHHQQSSSTKCTKVLINGGGKHPPLKRVSFGSSKGSMVETLIFETPVQEEPETSPIQENATPFPADHDQPEAEREKVRVSIVQQSKPQEVVLPDEPVVLSESEFRMAAAALSESSHNSMVTKFVRQESTDSGWDNPFRPGGDLSREADEIVELIKGGKPITPTGGGGASPIPAAEDYINSNNTSTPITESPKKANVSALAAATPTNAKNGKVQNDVAAGPKNSGGKVVGSSPPPSSAKNDAVDVQRANTIAAGDASQVEHVVIKKKPKCKCCVIQ